MLYGLIVALIRLFFGRFAIYATLTFDTLVFEAAVVLLAKALPLEVHEQLGFFAFASVLPVSLVTSYTGMEIPLQVFAITWALYILRAGRPSWLLCVPVFLLPLVRPDALAYALLLALLAFSFDRKVGTGAFGASLAGVGSLLLLNRFLNGFFVPITLRAKEISYNPSNAPTAILHNIFVVFFSRCFAGPVPYWLARIGSPLILLYVAIAITAARKYRGQPSARIFLFLLVAGIAIPLCYAYGGVGVGVAGPLFPWYFYTSAWLISALGCYQLVIVAGCANDRDRHAIVGLAIGVLCVLSVAQLFISVGYGIVGFRYLSSIGRDIGRMAQPGDSLELEPAGYIPFYAGIRTEDEIGLASETIVDYRIRYGHEWFMAYLRQEGPTFLLEKEYFENRQTLDGDRISPVDWQWFVSHYRLVRTYSFNDKDYVHNAVLLRALRITKSDRTTTYSLYVRTK